MKKIIFLLLIFYENSMITGMLVFCLGFGSKWFFRSLGSLVVFDFLVWSVSVGGRELGRVGWYFF